MLESLREKWSYRSLRRAKREPRATRSLHSLDTARYIQLLVAYDNPERFELVVEHGRRLVTPTRQVQVITVCLEKHPPEQLILRPGVVLFTRSSVSWLFKPREPQLHDVTTPHPDLLIDFSLQPHLTLLWAAYLSRANIKVGFCELESLPLYDITFAMQPRTTIDDQFDVLQQYLSHLSGSPAE